MFITPGSKIGGGQYGLRAFPWIQRVMPWTATQQAQARSNVYAAPFDALAYSGMQVNGSMEVDQQRGGGLVSGINDYAIDCWAITCSGSMVLASQQVTDAPAGYNASLKVTVTTAEASLGSGDYAIILTPIEGYRVSRLAFGSASAQSVAFGFWVKANRNGAYSGSLRNAAANRSCPFSFTINSSNTWEFKTVALGGDTTGTWLPTNGKGISVGFAIAGGSSVVGAANTWAAANYLGSTGTTNGVAATSDTFQITGFVFLPGVEVPSSSRASLIMRPFDQELWTSRRYWVSSFPYGTLPADGLGQFANSIWMPEYGFTTGSYAPRGLVRFYPTLLRDPTTTLFNVGSGSAGQWSDGNGSTGSNARALNSTRDGLVIDNSDVALPAITSWRINWKSDARL